MHKNVPVAIMSLNDTFERIEKISTKSMNAEYGPFLGNITIENMNRWWKNRMIPGARANLQEVLANAGCQTSGEYLAKNLALSLTDTYWIRPIEMDVTWEDVNLFTHLYDHQLKIHNENSYHEGSSLNGQMRKYWERISADPIQNYLIKQSEISEGQQNINETFAGLLHQKQGKVPDTEYVVYEPIQEGGYCTGSRCSAFTSEDVELVYATDVVYSQKERNEESVYEMFLHICTEQGLRVENSRSFMEYLLMTDFILANQDRHMNNFGLLRDTETLQILGFAPIYDTGNSMYWNTSRILKPYDLLSESMTGFTKKSAENLRYIRNRELIDLDKLPTKEETIVFYQKYGMSASRAEMVAENYQKKRELFEEYQEGKDFSLYLEKLAGRERA